MIRCPECGHPTTKVVNSRPKFDRSDVFRRRECTKCKHRFNTSEVIVGEIPDEVRVLLAQFHEQVGALLEDTAPVR